jgi:hypothetical protein
VRVAPILVSWAVAITVAAAGLWLYLTQALG